MAFSSTVAFPSLESAPCPPYFVNNIYDIFVAVAVNQSLTVEQYTTIASNCNIFPSTTTTKVPTSSFSVTTEQSTVSTLSSTLTTEQSTISTPSSTLTTKQSTVSTPSSTVTTEQSIVSTTSSTLTTEQSTETTSTPTLTTEQSTVSTSFSALTTEQSTETTSSSTITTEQSTETTSFSTPTTEHSTETASSPNVSTEPSTVSTTSSTLTTEQSSETTSTPILTTKQSTVLTPSSTVTTEQSTVSTTSTLTTEQSTETTSVPTLTTKQSTISTSSSSMTTEESTVTTSTPTTEQSTETRSTSEPNVTTIETAIPRSSTLSLSESTLIETTFSTHSTTALTTPVVSAANACNAVCKVVVGSSASLFFAICIFVFICVRLQQNRKRRKVHYEIHGFRKRSPEFRPYDHVMHVGNFRKSSSCYSDSPVTFYRGHSRSPSDNSLVFDREPLQFVNQIYLPDTVSTNIFETGWYQRNQHLKHSSSLETNQTSKPKLVQSKSLESYTLNGIDQPPRDSIYKRNCRPTRSSIKRKSNKGSRSRGSTMGNPYSLEDYESESSFDANGPVVYDGPITFTPEFDRRPFPKVPSDLRRDMIEQARDSRRDNTANQSRRRSRSHDPNLETRGYMERQFSFDLDPDCPDYRPAGRYKKHNPRQRKVSTASREFNMDNMNRYSTEVDADNNYMFYDGYGHNLEKYRNHGSNNSLRNRTTEQKVINSILKNGKPPNNRSRSDCSGEGLSETQSAADVFVANRNRSQSHSAATIGNTVKTEKPNTIYFYQTRL